jgi:hypothetical protein
MMRPTTRRRGRSAWPVGLGAALLLAAAPAFGQVPQPKVPDINQRSGLLQRFMPVEPTLPPDPRRDTWYDTRWGDPPNRTARVNRIKNGGLYGLFWRASCTESIYPYFYGAPGQSTLTADCRRAPRSLRWISNFVHPFRPVGMYYDQGSYVPIYDLDPVVPGPGPFPWPIYYKGGHGG